MQDNSRNGFDEGVQAYERGDFAHAAEILRPIAEQGDVDAQSILGAMCAEGKGVPQDYDKAVRWYRKAADQGDVNAQYNLGNMYNDGQGVPQNYGEAAKCRHSSILPA